MASKELRSGSSYTRQHIVEGITGAIDSNDDALVDALLAELQARKEPDYLPTHTSTYTTTPQNRSDSGPTVG